MSIFTPFTFLVPEAAAAPAAWTPLDFANLSDYWEPNTGITFSGGDVDSWTGANGTTLNYQFTRPGYSGSATLFNGEPSVNLNKNAASGDTGGLTTSTFSSANSDKTIMLIGYLHFGTETGAGFSNLINFNPNVTPRMGIFGQDSGGNDTTYACYRSDGPGDVLTYNGNTYVDGTYQMIRVSYNRTTGVMDYYGGNTISTLTSAIKSQAGSAGSNFTGGSFNVGSYQNAFSCPRMDVVEVLLIDGIPSGTEMSNYQTWLSNTYGLS